MSDLPNLALEGRLWAQGYRTIAGIDEAGRGAWAGPVVAAAVVLPLSRPDVAQLLCRVRDSKLMTPRQRDVCFGQITDLAVCYGVGSVSAERIDELGIVAATRVAMAEAVASLSPSPDYLLIDALRLSAIDLPQQGPPKADRHHLSVAAASVVAKVTRDRAMVALGDGLPGYGMAQHKGYGTARHRAALTRLGLSGYHRRSFMPMRQMCGAPDA